MFHSSFNNDFTLSLYIGQLTVSSVIGALGHNAVLIVTMGNSHVTEIYYKKRRSTEPNVWERKIKQEIVIQNAVSPLIEPHITTMECKFITGMSL